MVINDHAQKKFSSSQKKQDRRRKEINEYICVSYTHISVGF